MLLFEKIVRNPFHVITLIDITFNKLPIKMKSLGKCFRIFQGFLRINRRFSG